MSQESQQWLDENVLVGYTSKRGNAWHWHEGTDNHFEGAVPLEVVRQRLFSWSAVSEPVAKVSAELLDAIESRNMAQVMKHLNGLRMIDNKRAWSRGDNDYTMGLFSDGYQGHDYEPWLLGNIAAILDQSAEELAIGSAGLLKGGAVAWVQIEMEDTLKAAGGFEFRPFLLATTSFDGSVATQYGNKVQAVVCDNTLDAALGEKGQVFKLKHTKHSALKIADARDALKIIFDTADDFSRELEQLLDTPVSDVEFSKWLELEVPLTDDKTGEPLPKGKSLTMRENTREELTQLWKADERAATWHGTALGVLQAANTQRTHMSIVRNMERPERMMLNVIEGKSAAADKTSMVNLGKVLQLA